MENCVCRRLVFAGRVIRGIPVPADSPFAFPQRVSIPLNPLRPHRRAAPFFTPRGQLRSVPRHFLDVSVKRWCGGRTSGRFSSQAAAYNCDLAVIGNSAAADWPSSLCGAQHSAGGWARVVKRTTVRGDFFSLPRCALLPDLSPFTETLSEDRHFRCPGCRGLTARA